MTSGLFAPSQARRASHADLTLHLGGGKTVVMRVESPMIDVQYRYDRMADVDLFGTSPRHLTFPSSREVTVTLDGYLGVPEPHPKPAPAASPAPAAPASDPASSVRSIHELPDLAGLAQGR